MRRGFWQEGGAVGLESPAARDPRLPPVGTVLKREHGGRTIEVTVRATGFEYRHKVYSSLSQLAQQVTGTRWNGCHFFGLRKEWPGVSERERSIRCAIYTRKSTEEGFEQPFNTLQAQREAAEAYMAGGAARVWNVLHSGSYWPTSKHARSIAWWCTK